MIRLVCVLLIVETVALSAQQAPTPLDIVSQLEELATEQQTLLAQLRALLEAPPPITDAAGLTAGLLKGGVLRLAPGTYKGNFTAAVPVTLIGTDAPTGRVAPADVAAWTLTALDPLKPVLTITASDTTVRGLTLTGVATDRTVLVVGSNVATAAETQPQRVALDQIAVLAIAAGGHRGVEAHAADFRLSRSYVAGFVESGRDSQAVWINNGPGPYLVENSYLEASGENILVGGDNVKIPNLVPSDITIRGNTIFKPQEWRTRSGSVKNSFELKNAQRVLFENNVIDGCWKDGQPGHMIVLTPRNQYGNAPWTVVQDVVIRGNRTIHHTDGYAVNILGRDSPNVSLPTARITIEGNLFQDSVKGIQILNGVTDYMRVVRNTLPGVKYNLLTFEGTAVLTALTWDSVVALSGQYGANSPTHPVGLPTLNAYTTGLVWTNNVIEKTPARTIPWPSPTSTPSGTTTLLAPGALAPQLDTAFHYPGSGW